MHENNVNADKGEKEKGQPDDAYTLEISLSIRYVFGLFISSLITYVQYYFPDAYSDNCNFLHFLVNITATTPTRVSVVGRSRKMAA